MHPTGMPSCFFPEVERNSIEFSEFRKSVSCYFSGAVVGSRTVTQEVAGFKRSFQS